MQGADMDGGAAAGGATVIVALVGVGLRVLIYADRYDRRQARSRPYRAPMVPRSPLLAEPRPRRAPEDKRPPIVEVPDRHLVRAARIVVSEQRADAQLLQQAMPVIEPMARRLMAALEGRGIIGPRDEAGHAKVLVTPQQLPGVFERWGIVEDG
jgi:DNA segregation ATPase FtsK/SpoIIIE-like protein